MKRDPPEPGRSPARMSVLSVHQLACRRGGRTVFARLDLTVAAGQALVLTGRNGSGKSSLLRCLALLTPTTSGDIRWENKPVRADPDAWRGRIGWLGHHDAIKPDLTPRELLAMAARLRGAEADGDAIEAALAAYDLTPLADRPGRYLSAGQKRRVGLARLLVSHCKIWLMDEPSTGLDEASQHALSRALETHLVAGGVALVATHDELRLTRSENLDVGAFAAAPAIDPDPEAWS